MWRFSAMIDLTKYDCFRVKERPDQTKYELLSILRTDNCDLKLLRTKLWEKFGVPTDRCIFYFDEDEDQVPINLECEFEEALELTRQAVTVDTIILLIVGNFSANNLHLKMSSNEHKCQTEICKELNASLLHYWYSSSPPSWFTTYMESMKKDIVTTITSQVQKDITEVLNKRLDMLALSKEHSSLVNEENQKKTKSPDDEYSNASVKHEPVNTNTEDDSQTRAMSTFSQVAKKMAKRMAKRMAKNNAKTQQQMYDELIQLEKAIYKNRKEEKKMLHEHRLLSQVIIDNLDSNPNKSGQVNLPPESIDKKDFSNTMNTLKTENELRMSCSVTGHQMLDENRSSKDMSRCDDRTMSDEEKEKDDESFEIIQMPDSGNPDELIIQPEEPQHNSSRDSPSFELLSETSSTRVSPPCSMYMNEDHFSTYEEEHLCTPACNLRHLLDFHECLFGRRFNPHFSYSMTALKLYSTMTCPPKLIQKLEKWKSHSSKCPIDRFVNDEAYNDIDEKDSQASYLSVCGSETQSQCSVQSHPSNDVTQSFHSHTTSVTDTTVNVEPWNTFGYGHAHRMEHPIDNEDVQTASMPTREDNPNVPSCGMCWRCLLTVIAPYTCNDKECIDCNVTLPEILEKYFSNNVIPCTSHNDTTQSGSDRPSDSSEQSKTMLTNERITELSTADPVHILPETLVTAAAQVGCFAYDTAREMFDKLRAHTKEESAKHRDGTKCDRKPRIRTDSVKHRDGAKCVDKKSFGHL